ncbi:hypothetical protein PsYK624_022510 [Phanerochaete sordida]|uniref:Uncharacterized protein n=1 Tax=Phanerochaete sordida TaxID=48140 RepID=A0A9P3L8K1_9APHY|nr:hypothetical protein PsYK624_022510 [Phanerochaete sordida]
MSAAPESTLSGVSASLASSLKLTSQVSARPSSALAPSASSLASQRPSSALPKASSASVPESVASPSSAAVPTGSVDRGPSAAEPSAASSGSSVVRSSPSVPASSLHSVSPARSVAPGVSSFSSAASLSAKSTPSSADFPISKGRQADIPPAVTSTEVVPSSFSSSASPRASSASPSVAASRSRAADPSAQSTGDLVSTILASIPSSMARSPGGPPSSDVPASSSAAPLSAVKQAPSESSPSSEVSSQAPPSSSAPDVKSSSAIPSPALSSSEVAKPSSSAAPASSATPASQASSTHDASSQSGAAPSSSQAQAPAALSSPAASPSSSSNASSASFSKPTANQANVQSSASATSTVTDHPETTLSKPIVVSTTDSKGHTTVTIPPVVTSLAVSTQANGSLFTVTHIEANPTGIWAIGDTSMGHGFFSHGGAVAGVFVVVGLIVAAIAGVVTFFLCKRRRRARIRHSISRPLPQPDNPFEDPRATPSPTQMRYTGSDSSHRNLLGTGLGVDRGQRNLLDEEFADAPAAPPRSQPPSVRSSSVGHGMTLAGVGAGGKSMGRPAYDAPMLFSAPNSGHATFVPGHQHRPSQGSGIIGLAITNDDVQEFSRPTPRHFKRASATPSAAPSTPSIYPATLPGGDEDISTESSSSHVPPTPSTTESPALPLAKPPRPPRRRPVGPLPPRNPMPTAEQAGKLLVHTQLAPQDAKIMGRRLYDSPTPSATTGSESGGHSPASEYPVTPASAFSAPSMYPATPAPAFSPASLYPATPATVYSPPSAYPATPENPFSDYNRLMAEAPPSPATKLRENFYTRRKLVSTHLRKPSLEWKH